MASNASVSNTICVYNIPPGVTKDDLSRHFQDQGELKGIAFPYRQQDKKAKITFADAAVAKHVLQNERQVIRGRALLLAPEVQVSQECTIVLNAQWVKRMLKHWKMVTDKAGEYDVAVKEIKEKSTYETAFFMRGSFYRVQALIAELETLYDQRVVLQEDGPKEDLHEGLSSPRTQKTRHQFDIQPKDGHFGSDALTKKSIAPAVVVDRVLFCYIRTVHESSLKHIQQEYSIKINHQTVGADVEGVEFEGDDVEKGRREFITLYEQISKSTVVKEIAVKLPFEETNILVTLILDTVKDILVLADASSQTIKLVGTSEKVDAARMIAMEQLKVDVKTPKAVESPPCGSSGPAKMSPYFKSKTDGTYGRLVLVTHQQITIQIFQGNIVDERTDVIVNAANEVLNHGGGIAEAIAKVAGSKLVDECKKIIKQRKQLNVTDAVATSGGRLPCTFVVHVVGPRKSDYKDPKHCFMDLKQAVINALLVASTTLKAQSVAIPAISSGIFGVPVDQVCQAFFEAVIEFSMESTAQTTLRDIHLVNIGYEVTDCMKTAFLSHRNG